MLDAAASGSYKQDMRNNLHPDIAKLYDLGVTPSDQKPRRQMSKPLIALQNKYLGLVSPERRKRSPKLAELATACKQACLDVIDINDALASAWIAQELSRRSNQPTPDFRLKEDIIAGITETLAHCDQEDNIDVMRSLLDHAMSVRMAADILLDQLQGCSTNGRRHISPASAGS